MSKHNRERRTFRKLLKDNPNPPRHQRIRLLKHGKRKLAGV